MKSGPPGIFAGVLSTLLNGSAIAQDVPAALQELGKHIFFDNISNPPSQSCSICHVAENGWTGGVAAIKNGALVQSVNIEANDNLKSGTMALF